VGVTAEDIRQAVRALGLSGLPLCVHASLRSFGRVEGGPRAVVDALLAEGCTVLVPTFSTAAYEVWPDPPDCIERNGLGLGAPAGLTSGTRSYYSPVARDIDRDMGALPAAVLTMPGRVRGDHPINSFSAVGPLAPELIAGQRPRNVYAPLEALAAAGGAVVLMGVGLERMTLLHLAEQHAGRAPFIRWAHGPDDRVMRVEAGGCSEGFPNLARALASVMTQVQIGRSRWAVLSAAAALRTAAAAIRANPAITHCADSTCERCNDAVRGGPLNVA
jgi:aminoglycoside N3'-acetyltransferase